MNTENITFRTEVREEDKENVRQILESSNFFYDFEIEVAIELVQEYLDYGIESEYYFLFADVDGRTIGYTCFGPIPVTKHSFDIYWIGVHNDMRGSGIGKILMRETEKLIKEIGGKNIYLETSSREKYIPTQKFYDSCKCELIARIKDFYDGDDDKLIYKRTV